MICVWIILIFIMFILVCCVRFACFYKGSRLLMQVAVLPYKVCAVDLFTNILSCTFTLYPVINCCYANLMLHVVCHISKSVQHQLWGICLFFSSIRLSPRRSITVMLILRCMSSAMYQDLATLKSWGYGQILDIGFSTRRSITIMLMLYSMSSLIYQNLATLTC